MTSLGRGEAATSAVQYALLVGFVVVVAAGALAIGSQMSDTIGGLARTLSGRDRAWLSAESRGQVGPAGGAERRPPARESAAAAHPFFFWALAAATLAAAGAAWHQLRRRKRRALKLEAEADSEEPVSPASQKRIYEKRQRLLKALLKDSKALLKNRLEVRHLMTQGLTVVPPKTTVDELASLMSENHMRHLLVCRDDKQLVGVISNRDLANRSGGTAEELMTPSPRTVTPNTPLSPAITLLIDKHISCLPVVENERLCGVLTTTDLVITLQCTLQVWLEIAQILQGHAAWTEDIRTITEAIDTDLAEQQACLKNLRDWLHELDPEHEKLGLWILSEEVKKVLAASRGLAERVADARDHVEDQIQQLASLADMSAAPVEECRDDNAAELVGQFDS